MPALTWIAHHRFLTLSIGFGLLVVSLAAAVWFIAFRSPGSQIDLRQALRIYRQDQRSVPGGGDGRLPPSGVYRYRTSGYEKLSFGGISRSFPAMSEMIVTDSGCSTMSWEPLQQHMEGVRVCPLDDGAFAVRSSSSYEQIAGVRNVNVIACPATTYFVPPDPRPGLRWHATCHATGQTLHLSGQIIGPSSVNVGAHKVPALHTRLTFTISGAESGTNPSDYWISMSNGLILRERETVDISQRTGPLGSIRYLEQMAISVASQAPSR
jgi:hypothetical protein